MFESLATKSTARLRQAVRRAVDISVTVVTLAALSQTALADDEWLQAMSAANDALIKGNHVDALRRISTAQGRVDGFAAHDWRRAGTSYLAGRAYLAAEDFENASSAFEKANQGYAALFGSDSPTSVRTMSGAARALQGLGRNADAQQLFAKALQTGGQKPESAEASLGLAELSLEVGDVAAAKRVLDSATQLLTDAPPGILAWKLEITARAAMLAGERDIAQNALDEATTTLAQTAGVGLARIQYAQAQLHLHWNEPVQALQALLKATAQFEASGNREHPDLVRCLLATAQTYNQLMRTREADAALSSASSIVARSNVKGYALKHEVALAQALSSFAQGSFSAASLQFERFVAARPLAPFAQQFTARVAWARSQFTTGQRTASLHNAKAALQLAPDIKDAQTLYASGAQLSQLLIALGELGLALDFRQRINATLQRGDGNSSDPRRLTIDRIDLELVIAAGELVEAEQRANELLANTRTAYPDGGLELADALTIHAHTLTLLQRPREALAQLEAAHAQVMKAAPATLLVARAQLRLAVATLRAGNPKAAQPLLNEAFSAARKLLPNRHAELATFQQPIAQMQLHAGQLREATSTASGALRLLSASRQAGPELAEIYLLTAQIDTARGRRKQAQTNLSKAQAAVQDSASARANEPLFHLILAARSQLALSSAQPQQSLSLLGNVAPHTNAARYTWHSARARALAALGRTAEAVTETEAGLAFFASLGAQGAAFSAQLTETLALSQLRLGQISKAASAQRNAYSQLRDVRGEAHVQTVQAGLGLASVLRRDANNEDAMEALQQATNAASHIYGDNSLATIHLQVEAALQLEATGQLTEAAQMLLKAQQDMEKSLHAEHPAVISVARLRARTLQQLGRFGDADNLLKRVATNLKRSLGATHPVTLNNQLAQIQLHLARGNERNARKQLKSVRANFAQSLELNPALRNNLLEVELQVSLAAQNWAEIEQLATSASPAMTSTLHARTAFALAQASRGNLSVALTVLANALEQAEVALGAGHPDLALATIAKAEVTVLAGQGPSATSDLRAAADVLRARTQGHPLNNLMEAALAALALHEGQFADALSAIEQSISAVTDTLGEEHPATLTFQQLRAKILIASGAYAQAESLLKGLRITQERVLGYQHPALAHSAIALANIYVRTGRLADAARLLQRASNSSRQSSALIRYSVSVATAELRFATGAMTEATNGYNLAHELAVEIWGSDHQRLGTTLAGRLNVALAHRDMPAANAALAQLRTLWANLKPAPASLTSTLNDAETRVALTERKTDLAKQHSDAAVENLDIALGANHPQLASLLQTHAIAFQQAGDSATAASLLERAAEIVQTSLPTDHPTAATIALMQVRIQRQSERYQEAASLLSRVADVGPENPALQTLKLEVQGELKLAIGETDAAVQFLAQAASGSEQRLGAKHPLYAQRLVAYAAALAQQGNGKDADPLLQRGLSIQEGALGKQHPSTAATLGHLAAAAILAKQDRRAQRLLERQLQTLERSFGAQDQRLSAVLANLGRLHEQAGELKLAKTLLQRSLELSIVQFGAEHLIPATDKTRLAGVLVRLGDMAAAEALYADALRVMEIQLAPTHPDLQNGLRSLAALKLARGDDAGAIKLLDLVGSG